MITPSIIGIFYNNVAVNVKYMRDISLYVLAVDILLIGPAMLKPAHSGVVVDKLKTVSRITAVSLLDKFAAAVVSISDVTFLNAVAVAVVSELGCAELLKLPAVNPFKGVASVA